MRKTVMRLVLSLVGFVGDSKIGLLLPTLRSLAKDIQGFEAIQVADSAAALHVGVTLARISMIEVYSHEDVPRICRELSKLANTISDPFWRAQYTKGTELDQLVSRLQSYVGGASASNLIGFNVPVENAPLLSSFSLRIESNDPSSFRIEFIFAPSALGQRRFRLALRGVLARHTYLDFGSFPFYFRFRSWKVGFVYDSKSHQQVHDVLSGTASQAYGFVGRRLAGFFTKRHSWLPTLPVFTQAQPVTLRGDRKNSSEQPDEEYRLSHVPSQFSFRAGQGETYFVNDLIGVLSILHAYNPHSFPRVGHLFTEPSASFPDFVFLWAATVRGYLYRLLTDLWTAERNFEHAVGSRALPSRTYRWLRKLQIQIESTSSAARLILRGLERCRREFNFYENQVTVRVPVNTEKGLQWQVLDFSKTATAEIESEKKEFNSLSARLHDRIDTLTNQTLAGTNRAVQLAVLLLAAVTLAVGIIQIVIFLNG